MRKVLSDNKLDGGPGRTRTCDQTVMSGLGPAARRRKRPIHPSSKTRTSAYIARTKRDFTATSLQLVFSPCSTASEEVG